MTEGKMASPQWPSAQLNTRPIGLEARDEFPFWTGPLGNRALYSGDLLLQAASLQTAIYATSPSYLQVWFFPRKERCSLGKAKDSRRQCNSDNSLGFDRLRKGSNHHDYQPA